jgi:recombination protein RecA
MALTALRSKVESALTGRVIAPFTYRDRKVMETVSAGILAVDCLVGGLPRGGLTEICGPPCSGRTSLLLSALASRTAEAEACALVDGRDGFDPHAAEAAGVELKQLLWVRCRNIEQALRATDLLIQGGGFGMIAVDLSDIPPETVRYVPLHVWFRFRRAVEDSSTILLLLEQEANAKTCASLVLRLEAERARWSATLHGPGPHSYRYSNACLLDGFEARADVLSCRMEPAGGMPSENITSAANEDDPDGRFASKTQWGYFSGLPIESKFERAPSGSRTRFESKGASASGCENSSFPAGAAPFGFKGAGFGP